MSKHWAATKPIQVLRNFLAGRVLTIGNRYADELAARTQPAPHLKDGPAHKLGMNYYYDRDLRRAAQPPVVVFTNGKLIESGDKPADRLPAITPGAVYVPVE